MSEVTEQRIVHVGQKYEVQFEQGATKGILGYKVKATGDDMVDTFEDAKRLQLCAAQIAPLGEAK